MSSAGPPYAPTGRPPQPLRRATARQPEAGHHLVGDQERAVLARQLAQGVQEGRLRLDDAHVPDDGLEDDRGDVVAFALEQRAQAVDVVVASDGGEPGDRTWNAGAGGDARRQRARAGRHEQPVGVTVVVARELHDPVPAGRAAGDAERAHRGLGAAVHEADSVDARVALEHRLGEVHLAPRGRAEAGAVAGRVGDRLDDARVGVAQDHRSPRADGVQVRVAVLVPHGGALTAGQERGRAADAPEGADGRVDASGDEALRAGEQILRSTRIHGQHVRTRARPVRCPRLPWLRSVQR